jgi:PAT family beta-lactamase induction signal transducer AmpG
MADAKPDKTPRGLKGVWRGFAAFFTRETVIMMGLGFASGLPFMLIFDTLSAWLEDVGVSLTVIAFFVLATFAYTIKFIWAPVIDRVNLPVLTKRFGHRRSWMLVTQGLVVLGLLLMAAIDPKANLALMAATAVGIGFISATQDIVIDAWRIEAVDADKGGVMAAAYQWGYRGAVFIAGVVPFAIADKTGWPFAYALMAIFMGVGLLAVFAAPREAAHTVRPIHYEGVAKRPILEALEWAGRLIIILLSALLLGSGLTGTVDLLTGLFGHLGAGPDVIAGLKAAWSDKAWGVFLQVFCALGGLALLAFCVFPLPVATRPSAYFRAVFVAPMKDFFVRFEHLALLILALICFYRISEFVLSIMTPFYQQLGFAKLEIAGVRKVLGLWMSILGVGIGGWVVATFGLRKGLLIGAFSAPLSHIGFIWLAIQGHSLPALSLAISLDNIAASIQGTVLIAYMSSLTSRNFTASQYALFSSLYALLGKLIATQSGRIVDSASQAADNGGFPQVFKGLFSHLPPDSYVKAAEAAHVTPQALGAGYMTYLIYTMIIGLLSIGLCIWLARAEKARPLSGDPAASAAAMDG